MFEIFKTVLMLSLFGGGLTLLLLLLKPITANRFSVTWQYYIWIAVLLAMMLPVWKWIPHDGLAQIQQMPDVSPQQMQSKNTKTETVVIDRPPMEYREISILPSRSVLIYDIAAYLWFAGMCIYLMLAFGSYLLFLCRKRKRAYPINENEILANVLAEFKLKQKVKIRITDDNMAPMLVGVFKPIIYLPQREIANETLKMIFLHELTHYKRKDLIFKWMSLFINAVHWFNPFAYLASANINEACEVSCDMDVTKNMSKKDQDLYMKAILDVVQEENGGEYNA